MAVLIVSRVHMVRDILENTCQQRAFDVGGVCAEISDLTDIAPQDMVVLHTRRPAEKVAEQIAHLRGLCEQCRIMVIVPENTCAELRRTFGEQLHAIMPEDEPTETLIGVMAVVMQGYRVVQPADARPVPDREPAPVHRKNGTGSRASMDRAAWKKASTASTLLSPRESIVLQKLREGGSNKDIAKALGICEATVKVYLRTCYQKIGAKNRTQAAVWASERLPDRPSSSS